LPALGYDRVCELAHLSAETGRTIRDLAIAQGWLTAGAFEELISPEAVCRLGMPDVLPIVPVSGPSNSEARSDACKQKVSA
jgi:aspartate ammonia-lyase